MRKLCVLLIAMAALVPAALPLMAQAPDGKHIYFYPPIRISNQPQNPSSPKRYPAGAIQGCLWI